MFIRYLAEQSLNVVKSERKPRRNIQYKDVGTSFIKYGTTASSSLRRVANAVARIDNLEFLSDVVPKTTTYREFKKQKAARAARKQEMLQDGQTTLDGAKPAPQSNVDMVDPEDGDPEQQLEQTEGQVNGHESSASHSTSPQTNGSGRTELQHFQTNGESHVDEPKDVEMG